MARRPISLGDQKESGYCKVSNIKIVNGAQTTGSISKAYSRNPSAVKKAHVQIKVISLESAPIDIANRITTATNTQNKVEPKDFLAIDPTQDGIAESLRKIGIQYCFRRGEKVIDPTKGLDVQELAMALAASSENMGSVTVAKRNAGSLTDPNAYYSKLFEKTLQAKDIWRLVERWRLASTVVAKYASTLKGREAQLTVHGNRFIEHLLIKSNNDISEAAVIQVCSRLKPLIDELFGADCYLAVLFKNTKKCEALRQKMLTA